MPSVLTRPRIDFAARTALGHAALGTSDIGPILEALSRITDGDAVSWYTAWREQADSLRGNALRSLEQFKGTLVHAAWYFARVKDALPPKATAAKAKKAKHYRFKYQGHQRARTR